MRFLVLIDNINNWIGKFVSMWIFALIGMLIFEITVRYAFNSPTIWVHETSQHVFGAYSLLAGAYVLLRLQHVKVDLIYQRFSLRGRAIIDSITYLLFFMFIGIMLVEGIPIALKAIELQEVSSTPFHPYTGVSTAHGPGARRYGSQ